MAKNNVNKYNYGLEYLNNYDYLDKERNIMNNVNYMLDRSSMMFKYHNLPDTIPQREIELQLQTRGYCVFIKVNDEYYVVNGGLGGVPNVYNLPTEVVISVPYLKYNGTLKIDEECVVIPNDTLRIGLLPLYTKYCTILNENEITMILATVNKRVQNLLSANDDNTVESAKQFIKDVYDGKLGVIAESKLFDSLKVNNSSTTAQVSMTDLFEFEQYMKASLYNEIGLSANFNMKRERLTSSEVEANTDNLYPLVDDMLISRRTALEKINDMFGLDIQVEFNSSWDYRLFNGEPIDNDSETSDELTDEVTDKSTDEVIDEVENETPKLTLVKRDEDEVKDNNEDEVEDVSRETIETEVNNDAKEEKSNIEVNTDIVEDIKEEVVDKVSDMIAETIANEILETTESDEDEKENDNE